MSNKTIIIIAIVLVIAIVLFAVFYKDKDKEKNNFCEKKWKVFKNNRINRMRYVPKEEFMKGCIYNFEHPIRD